MSLVGGMIVVTIAAHPASANEKKMVWFYVT